MIKMEFDLHIHSKYSYDSLLKPKKILKIAKKKNLAGIAITDHNTIKGGLECLFIAKSNNSNMYVIVGSEIKTDKGEIIGLFLNEEIKCNEFYEVLDAIRNQDGIIILPHPFRKQKSIKEDVFKNVNLIEGLNSRTKKELNNKAQILCKKTGLNMVAGSDAHIAMEIGRARTIFPDNLYSLEDVRKALLNGKVDIAGKESPYWVHGCSVAIEKVRNREFLSLIRVFGKGVTSYVKNQW